MSPVKGLRLGRLEDAAESRVGPRTAIVPVRFTPLERERLDEITRDMGLAYPLTSGESSSSIPFPFGVRSGRYLK
jgi:hypothetical protein